MDQIKIGKFISELRKEKNMTQAELGEKIGVSYKTISKWENGRGMPELATLKPLSEEFGISINELLSGEKIKGEAYQEKLEENIINTIDYSNKQVYEKDTRIGIILLIFGVLTTLAAASIFPSESSWNSIYSVIGCMISLIGFSKLTKRLKYIKRVLLNFGFFIAFMAILFTLDYINVINNHQAPKFSFETKTTDNMIIYQTPFYNVYRINRNTNNEYYVVDTKKEYTEDTVPISPFNRTKSGIDNIIKYQNKYVGNNSNDSNLVKSLPLSEYGYVIEIDSENLGLTIDYHITDWYINEDLYLEKSLLYNSVSIFSLIDNVKYINFSFSGKNYKVERTKIEELYPSFIEIKKEAIDKDNFNKYVENKMNDYEFVKNTFSSIFE